MNSLARDFRGSLAASEAGGTATEIVEISVNRSIGRIEAEWRAFATTAVGHVFQTVDFLRPWLDTVAAERAIKPLIVVGRGREGAIQFILPFGVRRCLGRRQLEWLGGEHADYHCGLFDRAFLASLAVAPERAAALPGVVVGLLSGEADVHDLRRQPATIEGLANPFAPYKSLRHCDSSHQTRLGSSWDSYYRRKRNADSRRNDRSKWRHLEAIGPIRLIDAIEPDEARRVLAALFAQKQHGLTRRGVANFFSSEAVRTFYTRLALAPYPRGSSHVAALECGGEIVATNWGLVRGGRYYYVMHSYADDHPAARLSPGRHLMYHLMQWCITRGIKVFDFTIGDEVFKSQRCEESLPLFDSVASLSHAGLPLAMALRAGRPIKRMIKANPGMWAVAECVRCHLPDGRS